MRLIVLFVSLFAAACGSRLDSPTSPSSATGPAAPTPVQNGAQLPFQGSYTSQARSTFAPPVTLVINGTAEGTATQLGRFTATFTDLVDTTTATSTGTFRFTAANGDWLVAETTGGEDEFIPPNVSRITVVATVVEGTGRFASATGTFTIHKTDVIDFAAGTSAGSASFEGKISLNK